MLFAIGVDCAGISGNKFISSIVGIGKVAKATNGFIAPTTEALPRQARNFLWPFLQAWPGIHKTCWVFMLKRCTCSLIISGIKLPNNMFRVDSPLELLVSAITRALIVAGVL